VSTSESQRKKQHRPDLNVEVVESCFGYNVGSYSSQSICLPQFEVYGDDGGEGDGDENGVYPGFGVPERRQCWKPSCSTSPRRVVTKGVVTKGIFPKFGQVSKIGPSAAD
jgi:hypothetical protein